MGDCQAEPRQGHPEIPASPIANQQKQLAIHQRKDFQTTKDAISYQIYLGKSKIFTI